MSPSPKRYVPIFIAGVVAAIALKAVSDTLTRYQTSPLKKVVDQTLSPVKTPSPTLFISPFRQKNIPIVGEDQVMGSPSSPVTMIEYGDFQCYFCGQFSRYTEPKIRKDYIDSGKVKFVFKNMAVLGQESVDAASAAFCAGEQGQFWQYHDELFAGQSGENSGEFSSGNLKKLATDLNLNRERFDTCLESKKYEGKIRADSAEGKKLGVGGTPTFFINGQSVYGDQPYKVFQTVIDEALKTKP